MNQKIQRIENDVQDRNSAAWKKLCEYVDKVAQEEREEFSPLEELGQELFSQIYTLPESISKLKKVKKVWLYGSNLKRIPPEIGQMESLEYFDPYTSYSLHWFPYEITRCKNLKDSRVSTRALYGNYKNRMGFPDLTNNPVHYSGESVHCSICDKLMSYEETNQVWISLTVGTDVLPLLANLCSTKCKDRLPKPPEGYIQFPHKGGSALKQLPDEDEMLELEMMQQDKEGDIPTESTTEDNKASGNEAPVLLKLIRKLWEK